jgi:hypothetical protein
MAQTYTFAVPAGVTADALLDKVRAAARAKNIAFAGDAASGSFKGVAQGSYKVEGQSVVVTVEKKPGFVPWGMVESALRDLFAGA